MNLIQNNPYRILGLLVGASATQFNRHRTRIPNYISSGNAVPSEYTDFSFKTLGDIIRTEENIANAASKLILDSDKMNAALFWFYKGNPITDEPAFDAIKEADLDQVLNIWSKLTSNGEVSQLNASAYSNLGTLYLSGILEGTDTNEALLEQGISLKLKFLESDYFKDFKALATDETFKATKKELQLLFLNQVHTEIVKSEGVSTNKFLEILNKQTFTAKEDFLKGFIQKPIEQIENKIEEAKTKRKANKANAFSIGKALFEQSSVSLSQLKAILGISNIKFSSISDKISNEVLNCGIDYFSYYKDSSTDSGSTAMDLFLNAKSLAIGNIAKQRCQENTENLQEWINDKPAREKQILIEEHIKRIKYRIARLKNPDMNNMLLMNSLSIFGHNLNLIPLALESCKEELMQIEVKLENENHKILIFLQELVLTEIFKVLIAELNSVPKQLSFDNFFMLKSNSENILYRLDKLKATTECKNWYVGNRKKIMTKFYITEQNLIDAETSDKRMKEEKPTTSSGGVCYIATMAFGDYEHPQVLILRKFRDDVLEKSQFGKWFIKTYYHLSPTLVEQLKNKKAINNIIRKTLNQFIKLIK